MRIVARKPADASPARMRPLARLPIFVGLEGRRVVAAGGSAALAWKAELLAACGAVVEVWATEPAAETVRLLARGAAAGSLVHVPRSWDRASLDGAALVVCDAQDEGEATAFAAAARDAGVPWNVIDRPAHCGFQFGSIVNRSPVVIGISTDGVAPILGQAIRRRIETLIPPSLAEWAALAAGFRARVMDRLAPGPQRRRFFERLSDLAFGPSPGSEAASTLDCLIQESAGSVRSTGGRATLVGAGPGDAEHLTLKAVRALQSADVILFDDLVSDEVLELARREAHRMLVGKRGGRESCRQEDINELMIQLARQGKHVVRLKSGDPMIFGRAGEEIAELHAAGIPVEVVPGISAAFGLAAALGVSLTHRDCAHSVRFVTGHARDGELPEGIDWRGLADPQTTLIVYMGGRTCVDLARRLIAQGLPASTPVTIAQAVSRPEQTIRHRTLAGLADGAVGTSTGPVLIGIGRVFATVSAERSPPCEDRPVLLAATG